MASHRCGHAAYRYTPHALWSVCVSVSVLGTLVIPAETDEPIVMPSGDRLVCAQGTTY